MSIPSSTYDRLVNVLAQFIGLSPEDKISCATNRVSCRLRKKIVLPDEKQVSPDVTLLFTMVPLHETVIKTAKLLAETVMNDGICNQNIIEKLLVLASENVCISAYNGYHIQRYGVAMG